MKMTYGIIGFIIFFALAFYLTSCKNKTKANDRMEEEVRDTKQLKKDDSKNNPYNGLRNLALNMTPEQIGLKLPKYQTIIYGIIMDWDVGEGTATLVAFTNGDASLYLSSGGGMIGGGGHDNIKRAVSTLLTKADLYLNKTTKTETNPLPIKNGLKFCFLTNKGKFEGQEEMKNIENNSSQWLDLFNEANNLITEIRLTTEKLTNQK